LKEDAPDNTLWRARFGRSYGPVVRKTGKEGLTEIEFKGVDPDSRKNGIVACVTLLCRHKKRSERTLMLVVGQNNVPVLSRHWPAKTERHHNMPQ
jgi:hypothetical protein